MQRSGLNIMVFDQQSSFMTDQSRVTHSAMRKQTSIPNYQTTHHSQQVISSELKMLHQKIYDLQQKTTKLQHSIKANNYPTSSSDISASISNVQNNSNLNNVNHNQIDELLKIIEQKIQIVIKQTKKIIQKLTNDFDRKITQINSQKNHEQSSITKIQNHYQQAISKMEEHYKQNLLSLQSEYSQSQEKMIKQLQQIENQFKIKKREFQSKEQQYIGTIEHLQNKLKIANKNKKMLEVTQEKKNGNLKCNILDNIVGTSGTVPQMNGLPPPHDTSQRRRKIFDGKSSNRSISPNSQVLSPIRSNNQKQTQSVAKNCENKNQMPETQYTRNSKNDRFQVSQAQTNGQKIITVPISSKYYENSHKMGDFSQRSQVSYQSKVSQKPSSAYQTANGNQIDFKDSQEHQIKRNNYIENSEQSRKSPIKAMKKNQHAKQTPIGDWEKFQDFNQNESSGSEEDVFFYPEHCRNQAEQPHGVFDYAENQSHDSNKNQDKLFSPFDLN